METRVEKVSDYIIGIAEDLVAKKQTERETLYNLKVGPIIEKFIKNHKYVVKNSMILRKLDPKLELPNTEYYYVVYTGGKGHENLKKLADELYKMKLQDFIYLEVVRVGEFTFDLKNNFRTILRIVSLLDHIFQKLSYQIDKQSGLRFLDPNLMRLQVYDAYCNPTTAVHLWRAAYQIEQALNKLFPLKGECKKTNNQKADLNTLFVQWISNNDNIILAGDAVLNILLKIAEDPKNIVPVNYFVVLSQKPEQEIAKIKKVLTNNIKVKKEKPGLRYYKDRRLVYHDNHLVAIIYNVCDKCYPYTQLGTLKIATTHLLINFYLIEYMTKKTDQHCILHKIHILTQARKVYLQKEGMTGIEKGPFQVFHHICWGKQTNIQRELLIAATKRKYAVYRYKPGVKRK